MLDIDQEELNSWINDYDENRRMRSQSPMQWIDQIREINLHWTYLP